MSDRSSPQDPIVPKRPVPKRAKPVRPKAKVPAKPAPANSQPAAAETAAPEPILAEPVVAEPVVAKPNHAAEVAKPRQQTLQAKSVEAEHVPDGGEREQVETPQTSGSFLFFTAVPSWLTSMIVHVIVLLVLALMTLPEIPKDKPKHELVIGDTAEVSEDLEDFEDEILDPIDAEALDATEMAIESDTELVVDDPILTPSMDLDSALMKTEFSPTGLETAQKSDLAVDVGGYIGSGVSGRGQANRSRLLREGGGTKGSEAAVALALRWFAEHQLPDGSWNLDHRGGACQGRCANPGSKAPASNGATALALLPFLGAGHTHQEGDYQQVVGAGLAYLIRNIRLTGNRGSLIDEGNYYSHGLCAIAVCEAYAMTRDNTLMAPAQSLLNETVWAQDPLGGGWRYIPQQPGDTSAVGWQLMALKSGHMAYLQVPAVTVQKAGAFLDSVQSESGTRYGYTEPGNRGSTTAVGLLCRMYLGWKKENPGIEGGVEYLGKKGPSETDLYYNYYATQVMRHYGGEPWKKWNAIMRDHLVNTQVKAGHATGSWFTGSRSHASSAGGRLYETSMATMILEVYYRHLPIYQKEAAEDDFPL